MCSLPAVLAGVQMGAQIAGGIAQNKQGKAAARQAEQEGIHAQQMAAAETEEIRYNNKRDMGTLRAAFGTRNVAFDSASMVDFLSEAAGNMDYAALMKEHEGLLARYQSKVTADRYRAQGKNAMYASILGGVTGFASAGIQSNWWKSTPSVSSVMPPASGTWIQDAPAGRPPYYG